MKHSDFYVGNDHSIILDGLKSDDGSTITDAEVTVEEVVDSAGAAVSGETLPVTLSHGAGGVYTGRLSADLEIVAGSTYEIRVQAIANGLTANWWETVIGKKRRA